jgi:hypothetical protein
MPEICRFFGIIITMNFVKRILKTEPYKLTIEFKNGEIKVIDLEDKIKAKSTTPNSKYKVLLDYNYFKTVKVQEEWETIYWDNGLDFCPDALYKMGYPLKKREYNNKNNNHPSEHRNISQFIV